MNFIKKITLIILIIIPYAPMHCESEEFVEDIYDILADNDTSWVQGVHQLQQLSPSDVLDLLTCPVPPPLPSVELQNRLQQNFYIVTHPQNKRSILDQPQFLLHLGCLPDDPNAWQFNVWYFFNQIGRGNYTKDSTSIASYLDILNPVLFGGIDTLIEQFASIPINIPTAQELLSLLRLQERSTGFMFDVYKNIGNWDFEWKTPIMYFERNFFVTEAEKRRIQAILQLDQIDDNVNKFVVSDQIGLGDTRFSIGYLTLDTESIWLNVGTEFTIPTSFAFAKGLIGSNFQQNSTIPKFDLFELANLVINPDTRMQGVDMALNFAIAIANKLSANLLQTGIGNNGHFGLALFAEKFMPINERFTFKSRAALEYLAPNWEKRFFITKKFPEEFQALEPFCNSPADQALQKLDFLNEQLILTFIPRVFSASIHPGFLFKFQSGIVGVFGQNWEFGTGIDVWWQSKERIARVDANPLQISNIRIDLAQRPQAYQAKLFGVVNFHRGGTLEHPWCWTLYGDGTLLSTGIGKSFNLSLQFSVDI